MSPASLEPRDVTLTIGPDVMEAIERWIATQPDPRLTIADALTHGLRDWLIGLGLLPFHDDPGDLH